MQHQGLAPAEHQRNDLVEKQVADGRFRRARQGAAAYMFSVPRNQEVGLIEKAKLIILATIGNLKPGFFLVRSFPLMEPVNVSRETLSGRQYQETAVGTSLRLAQFGQANGAFHQQLADAVSGRAGSVEPCADSPACRTG